MPAVSGEFGLGLVVGFMGVFTFALGFIIGLSRRTVEDPKEEDDQPWMG